MSNKLRRFLRSSAPLFAVMLFLLFLNQITNGFFNFPWALIPIAAMGIPVFINFVNILLGDDKPEQAADREARHNAQGRVGARFAKPEIASKLAQAQAYKKQIDAIALAETNPAKKERLRELSVQVNEWTGDVEEMARQLDAFKRNDVIQRDLVAVPEAIKKLTTQLANETDPRVKAQLERTLAVRSDQWGSLQRLQSLMRQSEVQMESTIAALGTIYSQALAVQSTNDIAEYSHLTEEVNEQSRMLRDQLEALQEVKLDRTASNLSA
jgi:hypothetical protein